MKSRSSRNQVATLAALADESRRTIYEFMIDAVEPVSRNDVAAALGMVRSTAAFHLERLAREGLLEVTHRRLTGRSGPGSGRPTKLYAPATSEISVSLPPRHYDLAASLLAAAVEDSVRRGTAVDESLQQVATAAGRKIGGTASSLEQALAEYGYQPQTEPDDTIILGNCPFHRLSRDYTTTVCGLNQALLAAAADSSGPSARRAVLDPAPGRCCVRLVPAAELA